MAHPERQGLVFTDAIGGGEDDDGPQRGGRGGVRHVSADLDQWLRMRMRSILRRRAGREGWGRGLDHHRYPNKYFIQAGLTFLVSCGR